MRMDLSIDHVPHATACDDEVFAQLLADVGDMHIDEVGQAVFCLIKEVIVNLRAGDELTLVESQEFDKRVFQGGEVDRLAVLGDRAGVGMKSSDADGDVRVGQPGGAADEGADTGQEFFQVKRFDEIVVGPFVEAFDAIINTVQGSKDQDRSLLRLAKFLEHLPAVEAGEHEVENDGVVVPSTGFVEALMPGSGFIDGVILFSQGFGDNLEQRWFIFDNEQTHGSLR